MKEEDRLRSKRERVREIGCERHQKSGSALTTSIGRKAQSGYESENLCETNKIREKKLLNSDKNRSLSTFTETKYFNLFQNGIGLLKIYPSN
jgi:hypothetical protein